MYLGKGFGWVRYSELPKTYSVVVAEGYRFVSPPDGSCFFHSLLQFFKPVPNTVLDGD